MALFNYDNPKWSINFNCTYLKDCSGRPVTANGARGLAIITNNKLTNEEYSDLFHLGVDTATILAVGSVFKPELKKPLATVVVLLTTLYIVGRIKNDNQS